MIAIPAYALGGRGTIAFNLYEETLFPNIDSFQRFCKTATNVDFFNDIFMPFLEINKVASKVTYLHLSSFVLAKSNEFLFFPCIGVIT